MHSDSVSITSMRNRVMPFYLAHVLKLQSQTFEFFGMYSSNNFVWKLNDIELIHDFTCLEYIWNQIWNHGGDFLMIFERSWISNLIDIYIFLTENNRVHSGYILMLIVNESSINGSTHFYYRLLVMFKPSKKSFWCIANNTMHQNFGRRSIFYLIWGKMYF